MWPRGDSCAWIVDSWGSFWMKRPWRSYDRTKPRSPRNRWTRFKGRWKAVKASGESGTGPILLNWGDGKREWKAGGKRDRSDIVKLGGPADVRAIFTRARHFDFGPPFAGDPWDDRPTLGPNVSKRKAGQVRYC